MASTNLMLEKVKGLLDTRDISAWENGFLKGVLDRSKQGARPDLLSSAQVGTLERIYERHFA